MRRILHILPHPGGGGETVVDMLCGGLDDYEHRRCYLAEARTPLRAAPSLAVGLGRARRQAREVDLLHVVGDTSALLAVPLLRTRPSVWGTHGLHLLRRLRGPAVAVAHRRARGAVAAAHATICSSAAELSELEAIVGPALAPRLVEVVNGIPLPEAPSAERRLVAREQLGLGSDDLVALFLGELEARKRPLDAARATLAAAERGAPVVLLVAGDGPLADELPADGEVVRRLGHRRDAARLLDAADVFLMPSEREGLSLALLEAMGHGLAIVASDGPGQRDAIADAGVIHPVGDVSALTSALERLAADPAERVRLGRAARTRAEERFTVERFLADMRAVFEGALAG